MDKESAYWVLQSAVLCFDGISEQELIQDYKINEKLAKTGFRLYEYLKSI
jgi:hypothetical protein